ncbi:SURF1 family cytochrome oxidase biogenesis protein [Microbacterium sp. gxy059]|uniref:SURF1 family cytochrome oxidase biogenesis protein n=1 Tax=Microbacterium sp. gxy059 TaxID=2957199 RepID=UPI003D98BD53
MTGWSRLARWGAYVAVAVVFAIVCAFLSQWQFSRNDERAARNLLIERNYEAEPVPVDDLIAPGSEFDPADEWHPVVLTGEYLPEAQMLVRNRAHGNTSAYEVVVPLRLDDGRIVAVDRGWVPPAYDGGAEAVPAAPEGEVTVVARLRPSEPLPTSGRSAPAGQLPTLHVPSIAEETGEETLTSAYALMMSEDPAPAARPSAIPAPDVDPGPHLSYAIQWILFAVMGFVFIGYMIRTEIVARRGETRDAEDEDDAELEGLEPESPRPPRRSRRPRRDRDAEEEDALLDA